MKKEDGPLILVVEDEPEILDSISQWLTKAGYRVQTANDAGQARSKLINQAYVCVLLDIGLGKTSGETVLKFLQTDVKGLNFKTPILLTSGGIDPELIKKYKGRIVGACVKPYKEEDLVNKVLKFAPITKS